MRFQARAKDAQAGYSPDQQLSFKFDGANNKIRISRYATADGQYRSLDIAEEKICTPSWNWQVSVVNGEPTQLLAVEDTSPEDFVAATGLESNLILVKILPLLGDFQSLGPDLMEGSDGSQRVASDDAMLTIRGGVGVHLPDSVDYTRGTPVEPVPMYVSAFTAVIEERDSNGMPKVVKCSTTRRFNKGFTPEGFVTRDDGAIAIDAGDEKQTRPELPNEYESFSVESILTIDAIETREERDTEIQFQTMIPNGFPVSVFGFGHIEFEWQDGRPVAKDGSVVLGEGFNNESWFPTITVLSLIASALLGLMLLLRSRKKAIRFG